MAINTALLIAAPMLQDYFVDKDTGAPLSAGIVTCYQDNSRTTLKNWYYQAGSPGAYTYITLPNPMTLSSVGTIVDGNGNDTIPFFYPYSETDNLTAQPYYITVDNSNGERQFTRQNFPFIAQTPSSNQVPTLDNYIINNQFWRNIGSQNIGTIGQAFTIQYNSSGTFYYTALAPSQQDGFSMPDLNYIKNVNGATETVTFTKFALGSDPLVDDITPEYYINHNCTASQAGETLKVYQFPISLHVKTLESVQAAITIQAQNVGGNVNNTITLYIYQFLGTGVTSPAPIAVQTLTLTNDWKKYVIPFTFPSASGATLGNGADDALYLQIGMPLTVTCDINFTLPSIYLDSNVPTNYFRTYDQVDSVISLPRTGDIRTSINTFFPYGWVPMSGGSIGNASSNATSRSNVDTWPLFNLLWRSFSQYTTGSTNPIAQMVTSAGSNVAYGATPIADFNANNAIFLTQTMGRVMLGTAPYGSLLSGWATTFTASSSGGLLVTASNSINSWNGDTVTFTTTTTLPTGLSAGVVYYVANFNSGGPSFNVATSFANAIAGSVISYTDAGTGTHTLHLQPLGSVTGEYAHTQLTAELAAHVHGIDTYSAAGQVQIPWGGSNSSHNVINSQSTGSSTPFNITQTATFYNMFMKL